MPNGNGIFSAIICIFRADNAGQNEVIPPDAARMSVENLRSVVTGQLNGRIAGRHAIDLNETLNCQFQIGTNDAAFI